MNEHMNEDGSFDVGKIKKRHFDNSYLFEINYTSKTHFNPH